MPFAQRFYVDSTALVVRPLVSSTELGFILADLSCMRALDSLAETDENGPIRVLATLSHILRTSCPNLCGPEHLSQYHEPASMIKKLKLNNVCQTNRLQIMNLLMRTI